MKKFTRNYSIFTEVLQKHSIAWILARLANGILSNSDEKSCYEFPYLASKLCTYVSIIYPEHWSVSSEFTLKYLQMKMIERNFNWKSINKSVVNQLSCENEW